MNTTIWKYRLSDEAEMPQGSRILSVQIQQGEATLWVAVDPKAKLVRRKVAVIGTGWPDSLLDMKDDAPFVGTFQQGPLVFHVYDCGERASDG